MHLPSYIIRYSIALKLELYSIYYLLLQGM